MLYREIRYALSMVNRKIDWTLICAYFDHRFTKNEIQDAISHQRLQDRERAQKRLRTIRETSGVVQYRIVPRGVIEDRDYRVNHVHPELTGRLFGDPLPEYSALAKRGNRVIHHPLSAQRS